MLNWLAGEQWVLDAFREGRDLYSETASAFYKRPITKADKLERFLGKTLELGAGYGVGFKKLQALLKLNKIVLNDHEAREAINVYRGTHENVVKLWKTADIWLRNMYGNADFEEWFGPLHFKGQKIILPNGIELDYSNLSVSDDGKDLILKNPKGVVKIYGGKLVENIVQALSRIVISRALIKISERYKVVLTVHDELAYLVPEQEAEPALQWGLKIMRQSPDFAFDLPLDAEGGYAREYSK
jgi:DNA polymerase